MTLKEVNMISDIILKKIESLSKPEQKNALKMLAYSDLPNRVFYGIDSEMHPVFAVVSPHPKIKHQTQSTRKLLLNINISCEAVINDIFEENTLHTLTCLSDVSEEKVAFIRLTEAFAKHFTDENPYILNELFTALTNLFSKTGCSSEQELQGLYAELYVILFFQKRDLDLVKYWQKSNNMAFDFSLSNSRRIEVKSTTRAERVHRFKHEQLLSELYNIIIISLLLRKGDVGKSLFTLIEEVRSLFSHDYTTMLFIERAVKNIPESELRDIKYDDEYTNEHLRFYTADKIPRFNEAQPDGVTHTEYDSDLSTSDHISFTSLKSWIINGGTK